VVLPYQEHVNLFPYILSVVNSYSCYRIYFNTSLFAFYLRQIEYIENLNRCYLHFY
jgi:hypothetical protein